MMLQVPDGWVSQLSLTDFFVLLVWTAGGVLFPAGIQ